jgi:hypothetical protein
VPLVIQELATSRREGRSIKEMLRQKMSKGMAGTGKEKDDEKDDEKDNEKDNTVPQGSLKIHDARNKWRTLLLVNHEHELDVKKNVDQQDKVRLLRFSACSSCRNILLYLAIEDLLGPG